MEMTFHRSDARGDRHNTSYPVKVEVKDAASLREAVSFDHVCAAYEGDVRGNDRFISSDCVPMDCDNDHSDVPSDWITLEKLDELIPDVSYMAVCSRSHMKAKDGRSPRPRFHVYFDISRTTDAAGYASIKRRIHSAFPFFDGNALDASRFLFGVAEPEVVVHEGWMQITDCIGDAEAWNECDENVAVIPEGRRNSTLSLFAGKVLKRYGDTEKARAIFLSHADKCEPPLEDWEVESIWQSALKFFRGRIVSSDGYVPPEEYNQDFTASTSLKPEDYSDIGQAKVLAREYAGELVYTEGTDYLRYDGNVWNETRQQAVGAMEELLDLQLAEAEDAYLSALKDAVDAGMEEEDLKKPPKHYVEGLTEDELVLYRRFQEAKGYLAFVMKRRDMKYVTSALQAAKPMMERRVSELDADGFLLNTPGVTYDLKNGLDGGKTPDPRDLLTRITSIAPGEEGRQEWLDALDLFFCGDKDLQEYVQRIVGLAAIGKVYVEALIIAYGEGSNGKSTFWNTIARVMGSYSCTMSADSLTVGCRRNVKPEIAELKGRRLVIASELEEGMRLNTSIIKQLCSTDEVQAEKKYKDPFHYTPSHTLVLYTNHLPRVGANDSGTWRRLIVIPFNARLKGRSDIKNYADHLYRKAAPYVMKWIIEGAEKVISDGFHIDPPECVRKAVEAYRESCDWLSAFLYDCCERGEGLKEKSGELYQEYRAWALRMGEFARSTSEFYAALECAGIERRKTRDGVFVLGLKLKEGFLE